MPHVIPSIRTPENARALLRRTLVLALFWWALTGGRPGAWWFYVPVVMAAALLPCWLPKPATGWSLHLRGLLPFILFFLHQSVLGGLAVAWRALRPVASIEPGLHEYEVKLTSASARIFMAHVVSLLPGTLSADLHESTLTVHALSGSAEKVRHDLRVLESKVAGLMEGKAGIR